MEEAASALHLMVDEEIPPMQVAMVADPSHGALSALNPKYESLGEGSAPVHRDSMFSQLFCVTFSIGDLAGQVMIGEETTFCCISSKAFCGFGGPSSCPAANCSCEMFKPELLCSGSGKVFCAKFGFLLPEKSVVCCGNTLLS
ncbi:unnamed protein product [Symbiodinium sp. KB8]|nr:unnamed protein product [Symbiodinium sp. KB8]